MLYPVIGYWIGATVRTSSSGLEVPHRTVLVDNGYFRDTVRPVLFESYFTRIEQVPKSVSLLVEVLPGRFGWLAEVDGDHHETFVFEFVVQGFDLRHVLAAGL